MAEKEDQAQGMERKGESPLKICHTCRHWQYKYKGFCTRLHLGVGKFWRCEDWAEVEPKEESRQAAAADPGSH